MNLLKFKSEVSEVIYIDADKIVGIVSSTIHSGLTNIYAGGTTVFTVRGNAEDIARYVNMSKHEDFGDISPRAAEMLEKRCGLCKHYEIGETRQCRKHFENRSEDDKVCHFYEP